VNADSENPTIAKVIPRLDAVLVACDKREEQRGSKALLKSVATQSANNGE
jgi:hypothetical protein|tara:strand:- start:59 stop:208 length:150 start_codon:yes stop_codon:yes gene_type:complete